MHEILTIGSALIDMFITSEHFQIEKAAEGAMLCQLYGEKLEVESLTIHSGGGANNTAIGFARAGARAALISELGKDVFSHLIIDTLHAEFVSTNYVIADRKEQTGGSVILLGKDGGRTIMVYRGASSQLDPTDISDQAIMRAEWVHLSSISGRLPTLETIAQKIRQARCKLSWNPGRAELELLRTNQLPVQTLPVNVLFVNQTEWMSVAEQQTALRQVIPEIVVTDGGKPGIVYRGITEETTIHFTPTPTQVVDETGAGDAFAVGYVMARRQGQPPEIAVEWALRNSQSVVQRMGATPGLLSLEGLAGHT